MAKDKRFDLYRYLWQYRNYNLLSYDDIRSKQIENLKKLLKHASLHTSYYKNLFKKYDIILEDIDSPINVLEKLPVLTKDIIAQNLNNFFADNIPKKNLLKDSTGGSTGTPLVFFRDKRCLLKRKAQELFFDKWIGYEIGDKAAFFVAARHHPKGSQGFKRLIRNLTSERILAFDPSKTDKDYMESFLIKLKAFNPKVIKCFPNSLFIFADFLKKKGVNDIRPDAVSCTGETLHGYQRKLFQEVFQCPVYEKYGTFEIGVAACECSEHDGMHMFMDGVFFEFLNSDDFPAKPGELAKLVVTDLFNYGFPLIRYKIGDVGVYSEEICPCGSPLPLMKKLYGRDRDILVDLEGNPKPGYLFVEVFNKNHIPGQFQVIQESTYHVTLKVVKKVGFDQSHEKLIFEKFKDLLGNTVRIDFVYVDNIPREPSGKYKYVQSAISPFK